MSDENVTYYVAVLKAYNDTLNEQESDFTTEMAWVEQSGIVMETYEEIPENIAHTMKLDEILKSIKPS